MMVRRDTAESVVRHPVPQRPRESRPRHESAEVPARRVPGRPRSEQANQAIMAATLEMLNDGVPVDLLSVEAVAARAGVGKATVYRRWPNKYGMVAAALASLRESPVPVDGRSVREDLACTLRNLMTWAADSLSARVLPPLLSGMRAAPVIRDEYYRAVLEPRLAALRAVLLRGVRRRELCPALDVELAVATLVSPAMASLVFPTDKNPAARDAADLADLADRIVDLFLAGAATSRQAGPATRDPD